MDYGLVSVVVPVYNREGLVPFAIDSILGQTYHNLEVVLINDGSTDNSLAVLRNYEHQFPDKVRVIDQANQGQVKARNVGIRASKGRYIAFLDSDDVWRPEKLELQLPEFGPGVGLVYCGAEFVNNEGACLGFEVVDPDLTGNIYTQLLIKNRMTGGTVVVSREALDQVGLFDEELRAAENWDLWIRVCKQYKAGAVARPLIQYRFHPNNMSKDFDLMLSAKRRIIEKHCDRNSSDKDIARSSAVAEADFYYRVGVHFFSLEEYRQSFVSLWRANMLSPLYEDSLIRMGRCLLGQPGNKLLRSLKARFG